MKTPFYLFFQLTVAQNGHQITLTLPPGHTYAQAISEAMQSADPGRIPYGVLYERVVGWANLTEWYSGDTTNFSHIKQAWWDLENCKTVPGNSFESLKQEIAIAQSDDKITLIGMTTDRKSVV